MILAVIAVINGAVREIALTPRLGEPWAHILSSLSLMSLIIIVVYFFLARFPQGYSRQELFAIGVFWVFLSLAFEFSLGRWVMHLPWSVLLRDYDVFKGRLLLFIWLTELIAPFLIGSYLKKRGP